MVEGSVQLPAKCSECVHPDQPRCQANRDCGDALGLVRSGEDQGSSAPVRQPQINRSFRPLSSS